MYHFTVLLLRPDYTADTFGQDTYQAHIAADTRESAVHKAQLEACAIDDIPLTDTDDYYVLFVCRGFVDNLAQ